METSIVGYIRVHHRIFLALFVVCVIPVLIVTLVLFVVLVLPLSLISLLQSLSLFLVITVHIVVVIVFDAGCPARTAGSS